MKKGPKNMNVISDNSFATVADILFGPYIFFNELPKNSLFDNFYGYKPW